VDRRIRISLIVAGVLVIAYPVAAWLIGLVTAHEWEKREQSLVAQYPYLDLVKHDYRRGIYNSTEELTYRLRSPLLQNLRVVIADTDLARFQVTVRNTIHHGPLPQMSDFAPATVDSEVILPPDLQAKLRGMFGNQAGLTIHTRLSWLGGSTTAIRSAPFEQNATDGTTIISRGLDGSSTLGRDLASFNGKFVAQGLTIKSASASVEIENLRIQADRSRVFEELYVGPVSLTLDRLEIMQTTPGRQASIRNFAMDARSSVDGEYLDMDGKFTADTLQIGDFAASRVGYDIRFAHVHGPTLAAFTRSLEAAQAQSDGAATYAKKIQEVFKTDGIEILLRDPVFEIPRIALTMPEGELLLSFKAHAQGLTRADLEGSPEAVRMAFVKHVQASADLRVDTALLDKLLDSTGKGDRLAAPLQGLEKQGYLKLDGKALTTHLTYRDGQLEINGLSFPAIGPMAQSRQR
jgi:uncharacterized protein YdgA (DUF945 family)